MLNPMQILASPPWQDVRFGSKADMCGATSHVRFTPKSDRKSGPRQNVMSALPPKADMCGAPAHVCFGPIADIERELRARYSGPRTRTLGDDSGASRGV
jgi:hypothetical protein